MRVLDPQMTPQNRLLGGALNFQTPQILTRLCQPPKGILLRGIRIAAAGCGTPCGAQQSRAHTHADTHRAVRLYRAAFCAAHSLIRGSTNQLFYPGIPPLTIHFPWMGGGSLHANYPSFRSRAGESATAVLGVGKLAARRCVRGMYLPPCTSGASRCTPG